MSKYAPNATTTDETVYTIKFYPNEFLFESFIKLKWNMYVRCVYVIKVESYEKVELFVVWRTLNYSDEFKPALK